MAELKKVATSNEAKRLSQECAEMADKYRALALELEKKESVNSLISSDIFKRASALVDSYTEVYETTKKIQDEENERLFNEAYEEFLTYVPKFQELLKLYIKATQIMGKSPFNKICGLRFMKTVPTRFVCIEPNRFADFSIRISFIDPKTQCIEFEILFLEGTFLTEKGCFRIFEDGHLDLEWSKQKISKVMLGKWLKTMNPYWDKAIEYLLEQVLEIDPKKDATEASNKQ